jgi:hypothetical protein
VYTFTKKPPLPLFVNKGVITPMISGEVLLITLTLRLICCLISFIRAKKEYYIPQLKDGAISAICCKLGN